MSNFEKWLNPVPKPNLRFVLSARFIDPEGGLLEWEMKALSAAELAEVQRSYASRGYEEYLLALTARALVQPDLQDATLLRGISEKVGRTILTPSDALREMVDAGELGRLLECYTQQNNAEGFERMVEEAKK